ncbi:ImmA/IrrE family metallo-endopeptidase [Formosa sediminum]|uniref:ImmA/IrrE family metallo-endopeptidase n=1 Tax=Formosa sediminum TaxID=2594004 RepID=A0A516GQL8_9FLAO|nr:SprT-like domain-containing protein [Formosa sediminum]QDO93827.1 ImmA/IrrE family metallo-endopeptidase [Formosa sediminum]
MQNTLQSYIPKPSIPIVQELLDHDELDVMVKPERKTRHGDYRKLPNGRHVITVNSNLNPYRFLITLIHEVAHFEAFKKYGMQIKPHGKEWKYTFQHLMLPFINPEVFPKELLPILAKHFINPKATSDTDHILSIALKQYDENSDKTYIFEVPEGSVFKIHNGRQFKKGNKRVKRFECVEIKTGKVYLFNPQVEIEVI